MLRKILHPVLALALAAGMGVTTVEQAQAGRGAGIAAGIAAGIIGLGIIGATAGPRRGYYYDAYDGPGGCYRGPRTCNWENRHCFENRYGDYVCRGGDYAGARSSANSGTRKVRELTGWSGKSAAPPFVVCARC